MVFSLARDGPWEVLDERMRFGSSAYGFYKFETASDIASFVALGPKNYSFETVGGESVLKCRGFSVRDENVQKKLSHQRMRDMVGAFVKGEKRVVETEERRLVPNRLERTIKNKQVVKTYRNDVMDKRAVLAESITICSLPFGVTQHDLADCRLY